jgi:hypothetical protein
MTDRGRWEQGWPAKARESRGIQFSGPDRFEKVPPFARLAVENRMALH